MPPRLELSHSSHKMLVPPPTINLRRAASYNAQDRGPLSSTSSRFSFNHLLFASPPPSPSLPALIPRPKKAPALKLLKSRPSRVLRRLFYSLILLSNIYCLCFFLRDAPIVKAIWPSSSQGDFDMVDQEGLPEIAMPIVVADPEGHLRWTVSIPQALVFPLPIKDYAGMGGQCQEISARARDLHHRQPISEQELLDFDAPDDYFMDVAEAEEMGILPPAANPRLYPRQGHLVGLDNIALRGKPACSSSMTFILEGTDAGLGNTLMMLWTFYGLAKEQGRDFFVDDSRWAYGEYTNLFRPPPTSDCHPPPSHRMLPCPAQAQHLLVTSATAKDIFPAMLARHNRMTGSQDTPTKDLFRLARTGYEAMFHLADDREYVHLRIRNFEKRAAKQDPPKPVVGFHVRRGDRHPFNFQYSASYIPSEVYQEASDNLVTKYYEVHQGGDGQNSSITILASDDPTAQNEAAFSSSLLAQERMRLAVESPDNANNDAAPAASQAEPSRLRNFEADPFGWEGGFYASMFWNLGQKSGGNVAYNPAKLTTDEPPSELALSLRSYLGRAYMMDLAVLAGASDHVVCGVSAMGCRLVAVMMGWDKAFEKGGWVNVDGDLGWTGIEW